MTPCAFLVCVQLPILERQVLGIESYLPVVEDKLPFMYAGFPST